ncbi:MAG: peptide ABC transporter substrate-binding protein, partial [Tissierellia bacterium]|nr:peptide ABC transporter substrate-binding protein [Tissierellia bacterium]
DGRPYIDYIVGRIFKDDELILTGFETGQLNLVMASDDEWERYQRDNARVLEFISERYEFLGFNFSNPVFSGEQGRALRKAIAYGIDRQSIISDVHLGHAAQTDLPIHPNSWLLSDHANAYGYDPSKAKEIIEGIGTEGISLRLITNSYNPIRLKVADMIAEDLENIGIEIIKDYPESVPDNLTDEMVDSQWMEVTNQISRGNFDMALTGWHLSPAQDLSFAFHSSQIRTGTNFIRYRNPGMDEALLIAFGESNEGNRLEAYREIEKIIIEDLPYVSLYFKNNALLIDEKVKGDIEPCFHNPYKNIRNWYIPKNFQ